MQLSETAILWLTFAASLVPVLLAYLAILQLRRRLRAQGRSVHPSRSVLSAGFILGGLGGMIFALALGPRFPSDEWTQATLSGPLLEEIGKALLPLALYAVGRVPDRATGIALGLVAGAGFAGIENLVFAIHGFATGGESTWESVFYIRLAFGTLIHMTASGLAGAVLGSYASSRRPLSRLFAPICAISVAWLVHGGWNSGIVLIPSGAAWSLLAVAAALIGLTSLAWLYAAEVKTPASAPTSASS